MRDHLDRFRYWLGSPHLFDVVVAVAGTETVKSHDAEVLRKLRLRDRVQAVVWCY